MKTILMIGNGFDLAHNLPTSYNDFLKFCKIINEAYYYQRIEVAVNNLERYFGKYETIKKRLLNEFYSNTLCENASCKKSTDKISDRSIREFYSMIHKNIWLKYFTSLEKSNCHKENWVDFEAEIFRVINYMENMTAIGEVPYINELILQLKSINAEKGYADDSAKVLEIDLQKLIRALEIYLTEFVEKIPLDNSHKKDYIENIHPDFLLSFNYTDIYTKLYDKKSSVTCEYIHGFAKSNNTESTNNMVLGISESLPDDRKNTNLQYIAFKKYYQRIYKKNGNNYLIWLDKLENDIEKTKEHNSRLREYNKSLFSGSGPTKLTQWSQMHELLEIPQYELYIMGHSLDITDGDIIKKFLCCDNIITTIYYLNNGLDLKEKISNLVRIIGQEELISRTGNLRTIKFEPIPE